MTATVYDASYAWYCTRSSILNNDRRVGDDEMFCAWCHKSKGEIQKTEDANKHIENHDKEDKNETA